MAKTIVLLIGPKGSGKSFIGTLMAERLGFDLVRVEDRIRGIRRDRSIDDATYVEDAFRVAEAFVRERSERNDRVVFESTGLTDSFDAMLTRLRADHRVITIGVEAGDVLCLERVRTRDASIHIAVSDDQVAEINRRVRERARTTDFTLSNERTEPDELVERIRGFLESAGVLAV